MQAEMTDLASVVERSRDGDLDAFGEIVRRFQNMAVAYAGSLLDDPSLAQDAAQNAFLEAFRGLGQLRDVAAFPGWFRRIVFKHADRLRRSPGPEKSLDDSRATATTEPDPLEVLLRAERLRELADAAAGLPLLQRQALDLYYGRELSLAEAAEFLGVPSGTVKKRLHDARRNLRVRYAAMPEPPPGTRRAHSSPGAGRAHSSMSAAVEMIISVRTGRERRVAALLEIDPSLIAIREEWTEAEAACHHSNLARYTLLHSAVFHGHAGIVKILLAAGADPEATAGWDVTPLLVGALVNETDCIGILLEGGADVNARLASGVTALHIAAMRGRPRLARLLRAHGADQKALDGGGQTALEWALKSRNAEVIGVLEESA